MLGDLVESMKKEALSAMHSANPTAVLFGEVIGIKPLQIAVEQRLTLDEEFLVLTRNVTDHDAYVTIEWESDSAPDSAGTNHRHKVAGRKKATVHAELQIGETVLLLRQEGGQKYIVLDRVV